MDDGRRPGPSGRQPAEPGLPRPDFQALFEAAPGLLLVLAPDFTIVAVSDAYLAATMTTRAGIVGRGLFEVFPDNPDDPSATGAGNIRQSLEKVRATKRPDTMAIQKYDIRRPASEGGEFEERFWSPQNWPVVDAKGQLIYIINRVEDVTELVRLKDLGTQQRRVSHELSSRTAEMEEEVYRRGHEIAESNRQLQTANTELRRSETFLDSVVDNIPAMVFVKDAADLRFVRFNRAGEELIGLARTDLIGKSDYDLFPADEADFFTAKDREVLASGQMIDVAEEPIDTPHGRRILHTKKIPVIDEAGKPAYLLGISEDITERKQADDEVRAARLEADRANRAKTEFLSRMSHELRTPLNAILGFSQLLEMDELTREQHENVAYISQAGRHLLDLINEVLDISRIESGQMTISREPVALADVLHDLVALVRPLADRRKIVLDASNAIADGAYVLADRQRLNQVLLNLLSNAVKYNREGGAIGVRAETSESGTVRIAITDTGYGIAAEHVGRLFHAFDRLGAERGSVEGTGMGLALSKGLIEAMGGTIGVESTLDIGTTFWVELAVAEAPIDQYDRRTTTPADSTPAAPARLVILQIEDNAANTRLVERVIKRRPGIQLLAAPGGQQGIALARQHRPDLILLDLHLPDMPGHEVLRLLQSYPETRALPVVVLSAQSTKSGTQRLLDSGAKGYLGKPLDVVEFLDIVDRLVEEAAGERP
jgi:PAS domain S-box-containing protein